MMGEVSLSQERVGHGKKFATFLACGALYVAWTIATTTNSNRFASIVVGSGSRVNSISRNISSRSSSSSSVNITSNSNTHVDNGCQGKERLLEMLGGDDLELDAYNNISRQTTREVLCNLLPTWEEVSSLYGDKPKIIGLDTCKQYRAMLRTYNNKRNNKQLKAYPMPRVAGLENVGSNAFAETLADNLQRNPTIRSDHSRAYNVPWLKHTELQYREFVVNEKRGWDSRVDRIEHVLPIVLVRDPYRWMESICKVPYGVYFEFSERHCPNLVKYPSFDSSNNTTAEATHVRHVFPPQVQDAMPDAAEVEYESLVHMWNEWYKAYVDADYPRLLIRYEDTIFHAKQVFTAISECAGMPQTTDHPFRPKLETAKSDTSSDLVKALIKNGRREGRTSRMVREDLAYAAQHLDPKLMRLFEYETVTGIPVDSFAALDLEQRQARQN